MSVKLIAVDMDGSFLSDAKTYNLSLIHISEPTRRS